MNKMPMIVALVLSLGLSGCGFHLKGQSGISQAIAQQAQGYWQNHPLMVSSNLNQMQQGRLVLQQLEAFGVNYQLVDDSSEQMFSGVDKTAAKVWLDLPPVNMQSRQTAQSALGSTTAETLLMKQSFRLLDADAKVLTSGKITSQRDRQVNPQALLASDSEKQAFLDDMSRELAVQLVQRLNAFAAMQSQTSTGQTDSASQSSLQSHARPQN